MSLTVLHVVPTLAMGGASRGVLELLRYLSKFDGIQVHLCVLGREENIFFKPGDGALTVTFLGIDESSMHFVTLCRYAPRLSDLIRDLRTDILHSHLFPAGLIASLALTGSRAKHVSHLRNTMNLLYSDRFKDRCKTLAYRYALRFRRTHFIAVSEDAANHATRPLRIPAERMTVILNGIDIHSFEIEADSFPRRTRPFTVGSAGRFVPEKSHVTLIDAVANLVDRGFDLRLMIAGSGSLKSLYLNKAKERGMSNRLFLKFEVRDMAAFYSSLDLFVLSSISSEGLPRVLLEAMACGCPVISTRTAGVTEVIDDGENGILVEPKNVSNMTDAIYRLLVTHELRLEFSRAGQTRVMSKYTATRVAREVLAVYETL